MTALGGYLKGEGFTVNDSDVPYGRDSTWERVRWLFVHHTASSCDPGGAAGDAHYIKTAEGRYPPLAQVMLGQDQRVYICAKPRDGDAEPGRASHAGEGAYPGIVRDCANQESLGIEVQCSGQHPLAKHAGTYAVLIDLLAALCRRYGLDHSKVIGHKEYSSTGKVDPRDDCQQIRRDVKARLAGPQEETMEYFNVGISAPVDLEPDTWQRVLFTKDSSDDGGWHKEGNGGVYIDKGLIHCAALLRLAGTGRVRARVVRAASSSEVGSGTVLGGPTEGDGTVTVMAPPFNGDSDTGVFIEVWVASPAVLEFVQFRGTVAPRA